MNKSLPIWILEPELTEKRDVAARKLIEAGQKRALIPEIPSVENIKQQLQEIRQYSRDNINPLVEELKANLSQKYPQVRIKSASDSTEAVRYITEISDGINTISINNSRAVTQELKPGLIANGFTVIDSYLNEFNVQEKKRIDYWELPRFLDQNLTGTFEVTTKMAGIDSPSTSETKKYLAVLGVNAVSAEDSTVFFLQHFHNIHNDLRQAKKVILVIGLDKIVKNKANAVFQTKCMGIFGMESVLLLGIQPKPDNTLSVADLPFLPGDKDRELHLILLDNDRTSLLQSPFKDFFLCIDCRSCTGSCPANLSGKPLSPKELIFNFKKYLPQVGAELLKGKAEKFPASTDASPGGTITEEEIWECTTCHACQEVCPVEIEHTNAIINLRRNLVMVSMSEGARDPLRNIRVRGHPWMGTTLAREDWTKGLDIKIMAEDSNVDILYWVGCTEALEDRSIKIAQALGKLLKQAGVNFGILGEEESCCGDPARRLGNEYQFQLQAQKNIKILQGYNVKKIVTACPHCYNTIKNEYPQFGGEFEVIHHTQFIAQLLKENRVKIAKGNGGVVTYHDACYLGRYNDIYQPPREILDRMPKTRVVEMEQNRARSFCCGGGGGRMWLEERIGKRISEMRIERAIETKAQVVATACPYCLQMFEDAAKVKGVEESLKVRDIVELVSSTLE